MKSVVEDGMGLYVAESKWGGKKLRQETGVSRIWATGFGHVNLWETKNDRGQEGEIGGRGNCLTFGIYTVYI